MAMKLFLLTQKGLMRKLVECLQNACRDFEFTSDFKPAENLMGDMTFAFDGEDLCEISMPKGMAFFSKKSRSTYLSKSFRAGGKIFTRNLQGRKSLSGWR